MRFDGIGTPTDTPEDQDDLLARYHFHKALLGEVERYRRNNDGRTPDDQALHGLARGLVTYGRIPGLGPLRPIRPLGGENGFRGSADVQPGGTAPGFQPYPSDEGLAPDLQWTELSEGLPITSAEQGAPSNATGSHTLGALSARYESGGRGPGTISSGVGDPGGVSYGSYQLSTTKGTAAAFVQEPENRWAARFAGLRPNTPAFDQTWRDIASSEPEAFEQAQHAFIARTHYEPAISAVRTHTGQDLDTMSDAVRDAAWSTSVQHHKAPDLLTDAVRNTDRLVGRQSPDYQETLINQIYDRRTRYLQDMAKNPDTSAADRRTFLGIVANRFPNERRDALRELTGR